MVYAKNNFPVVLKCLHNSQDITSNVLREIETHMILSEHTISSIAWCYGITKDPESRDFMIVMGYAKDVLNIIKQCWDADPLKRPKANELQELLYDLYSSTIYTSRLLDFKNLPEPKNAIDNKDDDNSFGEYSDFTKLDLDKSS
ncbi:unnamed protein product [Rhizophagus irregularis]|nr:unnamed protein product [Rhizophagus irregularis]